MRTRMSGGVTGKAGDSLPMSIRIGPRFQFQIRQEALEGRLIGIVIFPPAEVGNEIFPELAGGILSGVGIEALPIAERFKINQRKGNSMRRFSRLSLLRALAISVLTHSLFIL